jgi:bifunctional N-acetylglucosamine-1-phosphate-uridyltransferase/glucosamine-1-phosphate-acetyltransferase GlmU-like protein
MFDMIIVAAGNGTRMGENSIPKVLTRINGKINLLNTLEKILEFDQRTKLVNRIFIVTNSRNYDAISTCRNNFLEVNKIFTEINIISISSGRGDGHAVLESLKYIKQQMSSSFIIWGDAYLTSSNIFDDCIQEEDNNSNYSMIIPVINEKNPYVTFIVDKSMNCVSADFSKRGEQHPSGFHDQCVFLCNNDTIKTGLAILENAFFKNGRYVTDSGELTFLYLVHYFYNCNIPAKAIITDSPVLSYNTLGEVKEIEKILNNG